MMQATSPTTSPRQTRAPALQQQETETKAAKTPVGSVALDVETATPGTVFADPNAMHAHIGPHHHPHHPHHPRRPWHPGPPVIIRPGHPRPGPIVIVRPGGPIVGTALVAAIFGAGAAALAFYTAVGALPPVGGWTGTGILGSVALAFFIASIVLCANRC